MLHQDRISLTDNSESEWLNYWESARSHRQKVTSILLNSGGGKSLCVWGAGSCHDISLSQLLEHCKEVTLVDLNAQHLQEGVEFQNCVGHPRLKIAAPLDLVGFPEQTEMDSSKTSSDAARSLVRSVQAYHPQDLSHYDVVASTGLLSQIVIQTLELLGTAHPKIHDVLIAVRRSHLHQMLYHLNPGGVGLLITDFMESDCVPELTTTKDLDATIERELDKQGDRVFGLAPNYIHRDLLLFKPLANRVTKVSTSGYWRWQMTQRTYACYAVMFRAT